jgi:hypothetical protein
MKYQASIERNRNGLTEEITEYYDGALNIGISKQINAGYQISSYCYYSINEALIISGDQCRVIKLNESNPIIDEIFSTTYVDGTEHILSPLNKLISNPLFKVHTKISFYSKR